jgi:hypothetical protein
MTLEINLYELVALFECCVLETTNGNVVKLFKILIRKMYYVGKKVVSSSTFVTS